MHRLLVLLVCSVYIASAVPVLEDDVKSYSRFIEFPDGDNEMHLVDLEAEPDMELLNEITRDPANNQYLLFTRRNPTTSQTLIMNNAASIRDSNFNFNVPTIVIAHGWLSNQNSDVNPTIRDVYLRKLDVNIIVLDWSRLALSNYITAVRGVPAVGRGLGQFLKFVASVTKASLSDMHLIGYSLGAHVVGNAGRELGGKAARVTGLDPAGPLWNNNADRLSGTDGVYVEAIHTDGGVGGLGIGTPVADVDFFPNGGTSQPGCLTNVCNHDRAVEFYAASVTYDHFIGNQCSNTLQITLDRCTGPSLRMGNDDLRKTGSGMYRVNTGRRYPY